MFVPKIKNFIFTPIYKIHDLMFSFLNSGNGSDILKYVVNSLQDEANLITDTLSLGGTKYMGVCRLPTDKSKLNRKKDIL